MRIFVVLFLMNSRHIEKAQFAYSDSVNLDTSQLAHEPM